MMTGMDLPCQPFYVDFYVLKYSETKILPQAVQFTTNQFGVSRKIY